MKKGDGQEAYFACPYTRIIEINIKMAPKPVVKWDSDESHPNY